MYLYFSIRWPLQTMTACNKQKGTSLTDHSSFVGKMYSLACWMITGKYVRKQLQYMMTTLQLIRSIQYWAAHTKLHDEKVTRCNTRTVLSQDKCPWTLAAQAPAIDGGGRCLNGSTIPTQASTSNAKLQRWLYVNSHTQHIFMACWHSEHCVLSFKGLHLFV